MLLLKRMAKPEPGHMNVHDALATPSCWDIGIVITSRLGKQSPQRAECIGSAAPIVATCGRTVVHGHVLKRLYAWLNQYQAT